MDRTIPSFRLASVEQQRKWKVFRNTLDESDRWIFDEMFSVSYLYNSACTFVANPIRIRRICLSCFIIIQVMGLSENISIGQK
jgi:hypothetical protein